MVPERLGKDPGIVSRRASTAIHVKDLSPQEEELRAEAFHEEARGRMGKLAVTSGAAKPGTLKTSAAKSRLSRGEAAFAAKPIDPTPASSGLSMLAPRVLVVEDDDLQRMFLTDILLNCGIAADSAADGLSAVTKARTGNYSLALIDYHLPEIDGLTAARLLRDMFEEAECPRLIAITATPESLTLRETSKRPMFDALYAKPLDYPALLEAVTYQLHSFDAARLRDWHGARVRGGGGW
jgi:CheY-like chemotaxis protein